MSEVQSLDMIPLEIAVLCLTCNCITASPHDFCSYCGAKGVVSLSKWLNRPEEDSCVVSIHSCSVSR